MAKNEWYFDGKGNAVLYRSDKGTVHRTSVLQTDVIYYDYKTHVFHVERNFIATVSICMNPADFEAFKDFHTKSYPIVMKHEDAED